MGDTVYPIQIEMASFKACPRICDICLISQFSKEFSSLGSLLGSLLHLWEDYTPAESSCGDAEHCFFSSLVKKSAKQHAHKWASLDSGPQTLESRDHITVSTVSSHTIAPLHSSEKLAPWGKLRNHHGSTRGELLRCPKRTFILLINMRAM